MLEQKQMEGDKKNRKCIEKQTVHFSEHSESVFLTFCTPSYFNFEFRFVTFVNYYYYYFDE